jgi:HSP20 family protein
MARKDKKEDETPLHGGMAVGGILKGLADLVQKLGEVAETGERLSRTGEIRSDGGDLKGIYGFTVKVGLGDKEARVEPFGNIRKDAKSGRTVVQEVREPVIDVFEEQDRVLVLVEMPGVSQDDVKIEVSGDLLTISARRGNLQYRKEVRLPASFPRDHIEVSSNNGIVEIRCVK